MLKGVVAKGRGRSLIECLADDKHFHNYDTESPRSAVVKQALGLLLGIHNALCNSPADDNVCEFLYNSSNRRIIDSLFDLISLEGIYPNLSSGVGVPIERRVKSVLRGGLEARTAPSGEKAGDHDQDLLVEVVNKLRGVAESKGKGLCSVFRERTFVDLIAALGQLAYGSSSCDRDSYKIALKSLVDEYVSFSL